MEWLALTHLVATAAMAGLIWFVQVVHYPLFARVPAGSFLEYEREHVRRTGWIVGPIMVVEAVCAGLLVVWAPGDLPIGIPLAGAAMLAVIWLSTAFLQVPEHRRLSERPESNAIRRLVRGNWIRTAAWTVRVPLAAWMAAVA